eukprot:NODE_124_length_18806_cov_0.323996.p1 type:complete len:1006 gc:universal NODE_124_length_18806_cov_0.323996:18649-15632(-)
MQGILPQELMLNIFGDGSEYLWAFDAQEEYLEEPEQVVKRQIQSTTIIDENITKLCERFFVSISELESSIENGYKFYTIPQDPEESFYIEAGGISEQTGEVESAVINSMVSQISSSTKIREVFCTKTFENTKLSVYPTDIGMREIDVLHQFYPCKYIRKKPISQFKHDQIIYILNAVSQNLLYLEWDIDDRIKSNWRDEYFEGSNPHSDWNTIRQRICDASIVKLMEYSKQYFIETLKGRAIKYITKQCVMSLTKMADLKCPISLNEDNYVLAVSHDNRDIVGAIVNKDGFLIDSFVLSYFERGNAFNGKKCKTLSTVYMEFNIQGIIIGGQGIRLKDVVEFILNNGVKDNRSRDESSEMPVFLCIVGDYFARLNKYSIYSENLFVSPDLPRNAPEESQYTLIDKYLTSLARYFINPTFEICSLFNKQKDYLLLPFHNNQHQVPEDVLYQALHSKLKEIITKCGIDINYVLHRPHLHNVIQFIPGIHSSRVSHIISTILTSEDQVLYSRADLFNEDSIESILTKEEFEVAADVIRIGEEEIEYADPLDDMRIHPNHYLIARKICSDALEEAEQEIDEQNPSKSVSKLLNDDDKANKLKSLELDTFAEHLASAIGKTVEDAKELVESIRKELIEHYVDYRPDLQDYKSNRSEVFYYVTGETEKTYSPNTHVNGEVKSIIEKASFITLECGLQGKIDNEAFELIKDDHGRSINVLSVLKQGTPLRLSIKATNFDLFQIALDSTLKNRNMEIKLDIDSEDDLNEPTEDLGNSARASKRLYVNESSVKIDGYYDMIRANQDKDKIEKEQEKAQVSIMHSKSDKYKNLDFKSACKYLKSLNDPMNYYVFRPSRNGDYCLNITWKIEKDLFGNIEIQQVLSGGRWILTSDPNQEFNSMDDAVVQYIGRIQSYIRQIVKSTKFTPKNESQVRASLDSLSKRGKSVPYLIHFDYTRPTVCLISYKSTPDNPVQHVPFKVTNEGYVMQQLKYQKIMNVINDFKRLVSGAPIVGE